MAGQIPPPYGGQNIMIEKAVAQFAAHPDCESVHLPFFFTADFQQARKASLGKLLELARVIGRLLRIRCRGPIDLLLYPTGGPQTVPIVRDILLLPWMYLCARKVVLHFHAAGVADRFAGQRRRPLGVLLRAIYRGAEAAVVMTEFNRRDPEFFGIKKILVCPHRIPDEFDSVLISRVENLEAGRLLYVGHLHPDKGTEALLHAFGALLGDHPHLRLELVGECLPPWTRPDVERLIDELGVKSRVTLSGVLTGRAKAEAFGRADAFIFPTIAPYESFGLVLLEAMMWALPILATDWRGNRDVLTAEAGAVIFPVTGALDEQCEKALRFFVERRNDWQAWGARNRNLYLTRSRAGVAERWLAAAILPEVSGSRQWGGLDEARSRASEPDAR